MPWIPLGKGQRELIIGDRRTGKTTIAVILLLTKKGKNVVCVYVAIGKRLSVITEMIDILKRYNAWLTLLLFQHQPKILRLFFI